MQIQNAYSRPHVCVILPFQSLKNKELSLFPTFPLNLSPPPRTYETIPLSPSVSWLKKQNPDHLPILLITLPRKPTQSRPSSTSDLAPPLTASVSAAVERPHTVPVSVVPTPSLLIKPVSDKPQPNPLVINVLHNLPLLTVVGAQDETAYGEQTRDCARYDLGSVIESFPTRWGFGSASRCQTFGFLPWVRYVLSSQSCPCECFFFWVFRFSLLLDVRWVGWTDCEE